MKRQITSNRFTIVEKEGVDWLWWIGVGLAVLGLMIMFPSVVISLGTGDAGKASIPMLVAGLAPTVVGFVLIGVYFTKPIAMTRAEAEGEEFNQKFVITKRGEAHLATIGRGTNDGDILGRISDARNGLNAIELADGDGCVTHPRAYYEDLISFLAQRWVELAK